MRMLEPGRSRWGNLGWLGRLSSVLVVVLLLLAACGGAEGDAGSTTVATTEADSGSTGGTSDTTQVDTTEASGGTESDPIAQYDGEPLTMVVAFSEGGGTDAIARAAAPFLADELGVNVIVENMPGAGGLVAANSLYAARGDGHRIGFFSGQGIAGAVLADAEGVEFDLDEFNFVARFSADPRVISTGADGELEDFQQVIDSDMVRMGSNGPGSSGHIDAVVLRDGLELNIDIITGFEGTSEQVLALLAGDIELQPNPLGTSKPYIDNGEFRGLLVIAEERHPSLPDIPVVAEFDFSEEQLAIARAHIDVQNMGRMVMAPPEMPETQLAAVQAAMMNVLVRQDFLDALAQVSDEIIDPRTGPELRTIADQVLQAPQPYVDVLQAAYAEG